MPVQSGGNTESLYGRLGGEAAIQAAVVDFYDRVLADDLLAPYFRGYDMVALVKKQVAFMTMAFGGPHAYSGRELATSHAALVKRGLGDEHFDRVAKHLVATLEALKVAPSLIDEVMGIVGATRDAVLGRAGT